MKKLLLILLVGCAGALRGEEETDDSSWFAEPHHRLEISYGMFHIDKETQAIQNWHLEYRPDFRFCNFGPLAFAGTGEHGEFFGGAGVFFDLELIRHIVLTPSFAGGYYSRGSHGLNLGSELEFRSALELSYEFDAGYRLSVGFSHLSNGGFSDCNPGTETVFVACSVPLDVLYRDLTSEK